MIAVENKQQLVGLVSGSASTLGEIYQATQDGRLPRTEVSLIISSNAGAGSYERFSKAGFDMTRFVEIRREDYPDPRAYGDALIEVAGSVNPDTVHQLGHSHWTPEHVIADFTDRGVTMINQHPGPVDPSEHDFGGRGMSTPQRTHDARIKFVRLTERNFWTDVTAQRVHAVYDRGKVLKRGSVEITPDDNYKTLQSRAILVEWATQIAVLKDIEDGKLEEQPTYAEMGIDLVREEEWGLLEELKKLVKRLHPPE